MELVLAGLYTIPLTYVMRNLYKFKFFENKKAYPLDSVNTGDIIFMSHNTSNALNNMVNIEFTHIAMAYRDVSGELYIVELTSEGDSPNGNKYPDIYPFLSRYSRYNGYFCVRPCRYEVPNDLMFNAYKRLKRAGVTFDYKFVANFLKSRIGLRRDVHSPNDDGEYELCCSEFVYLMLCNMGLIKYDDDDFHDSFRFLSGDEISDIYYDIMDIDTDYRDDHLSVVRERSLLETTV